MFDSITVQTAAESANIQTLIFTILLAFILSSLLAIVYQKTLSGREVSKTYVQSVILISLIAAVIIQAIGDSLARGLGIMAAMAIIRFRTNLKDPRDLLFLFASLAAGISCGSYAFDIAIVGTVGFAIATIILSYTSLGPDKNLHATLSFSLSSKSKERQYLEQLLNSNCQAYSLEQLKDIDDNRFSYRYKISLKEKKTFEACLRELKRLPSMKQLSLKLLEVK